MSKHSPGEWQRNIPPATKYVTVFTGRNTHIFDVLPARGVSAEEAEANLNLIVTAPALLAVLRMALAELEHVAEHTERPPEDEEISKDTIIAIRAALAAAERV